MTSLPDRTAPDGTGSGSTGGSGTGRDSQDFPSIVISGLDEPGGQPDASPVNISPTDEAVQRLHSQRARGEPEDEDG